MLTAVQKKIMKEIRDYFKRKEDDYLEYDNHSLSSVEDLMNPDVAAPWDSEEDGDYDNDIRNLVGK
jgi:hypothetical protein